MSLVAVCPNCHVRNDPSRTHCEVCKIALGALLIDAERGRRLAWLLAAAGLALAMFLPVALLGKQTLWLPLFYGPLVASYYARGNVVWSSALGGLAAGSAVVIVAAVGYWSDLRHLLVFLMGGTQPDDPELPTTTTTAVMLGGLVMFAIALAVCLIGASVGEHLSQHRRARAKQTAG
jgi:hypothetical protein